MSARAELLSHHVFVDLETTGLDPSRDEVIELGALFVENGEVVRRVQRLFRPTGALPLAIRRITGIKDEDLATAPPFEAFRGELETLLRGWTVVAHNASFEESFLSETFERAEAQVLDSCELLHYLYPELESHSLEAVIRWAKAGEKAAHRALKDCEDTCAVLCFALDRFVDEGRLDDVKELLEVLDGGERSPLLDLLQGLKACVREVRPELELTTTNTFLAPRAERVRRTAKTEAPPEQVAITDLEVEAVVGAGGALEKAGSFSARQQQREMAREVAHVFNTGGSLAVEAGTGTGKSLGYLAPAALFAVKNAQKVAVATHTRTLQDQLVDKDLPRLHKALGGSFGYAVLKGQSNYICRRRATEATAVDARMDHSERAPRAYLRALLRRSQDGDLDKLSYWFKEHYPALNGLTQAIRSESATTLGERCPHYRRCYYHSAVAHAKEADVLVVNQALAFAWPNRYPKLDHLILDEAHEVEDAATTALETELSRQTFLQLSDRLSARARTGVLASVRRALAGSGSGRTAKELVDELEGRVNMLLHDADALGEAVAELAGFTEGASYSRELRLTAEVHASKAWIPVHAALTTLQGDFDELRKSLRSKVLDLMPELPVQRPALDKELSGAEELLSEVAACIDQFGKEPAKTQCLFATARRTHTGALDWGLHSQPTDVSGFIASAFAAERKTLILTSATLSTGPDAPWVLERLGLSRGEKPTRFLTEPTPFDLKSQTLVVMVTDAPDPQSEEFVDWSSARLSGLAQFLGGRVLGLFASARRLEEIGGRVRQTLEPVGIEVMRQSRGNGRAMAAKQEQDAGTVLLGTKSFWQGIDIPGRGLSCVFIDKLPLEPQSRPIVAAREERFMSGGKGDSFQGFMQYRLPRALIQLRQGVGRLIRSSDDRGVVIIADPGSPAYRAKVLAALSGYRVEVLPWAKARVRIFEAFKEMGLARTQPPVVAQSA